MTADHDSTAGEQADEPDVHARIAEALAGLVARDGETPPPPYVRRYLAGHAQLGGALDDAHVPPELLPWLTGAGIRGLLASSGERDPGSWLEAWATVEPYLHRADVPSRLASLHLAYAGLRFARVPRARMPAEVASSPGSRLAVLWSQWTPPVNVLAKVAIPVHSLASWTTPDGRPLVAAGDEHGGIEIIDPIDGSAVGERISAHEGTVRCLLSGTRAGQGPVLVSGSADGSVRAWDPVHGSLIDQIHQPAGVWIDDLSTYRDTEDELAVLAVNGFAEVVRWNERMGAQDLLGLPGVRPRAGKIALTTIEDETGRRLLAIADGTSLTYRDPDDCRQVTAAFDLPSPVRALTSTTRPGQVAAGHADGSVTVWDIGGKVAIWNTDAGPVTSLTALAVGSRHLLAAGSGKDIALWDTGRTGPATSLTGHSEPVTALTRVTLKGGDALASASLDNTLRLWDQKALDKALGTGTPAPPPVTDGTLARDDHASPSWFALSGSHPGIEVWDIVGGAVVASVATETPPTAVTWGQRAQGRALLWAGPDHRIHMWDASTRTHLPHPLEGHIMRVRALAPLTTTDGRHLLLSGSDDYTAKLWDLDDNSLLRDWSGHDLRVLTVAAASNHQGQDWFATAGADGTVRLWNMNTDEGAPRQPFRCMQGRIHTIGINPSPAGGTPPHLASAGQNGTIRLWDLLEHRQLNDPLIGHTGTVRAVTLWTLDSLGDFLASASDDGTIRIWNIATARCLLLLATGSPVRTLSAHPSPSPTRIVLAFAGEAGAATLEIELSEHRRKTP
ncbi:WD40 repeat domain-containing protein [Streptomyces sp. NPDC002602]|uniref:WD40 repeat domain-containing protein n=1 Tax=Streptomyces sp. NPDC002602 TaxID=3364654 RepID=UPI0036B62EDD